MTSIAIKAGLFISITVLIILLIFRSPWATGTLRIVTNPDEVAKQKGFSEYFANLSECDVAARTPLMCATSEGYLSLIRQPSPDDVAYLESAVEKARRAIRNASPSSLVNYLKIDRETSKKVVESMRDAVPWKIVILDERAENGWPHTHGDIICIPKTFRSLKNFVQTLVHERVHVIQRRRPDLFSDIAIESWGMSRISFDEFEPSDALPFRRSNPDLDGYLYARKDGVVPISLFDSIEAAEERGLNASAIRFFKNGVEIEESNGEEEHPYETQAYLIAEAIVP